MKTPIEGLTTSCKVNCKQCNAEYHTQVKYMLKRGLGKGMCGKCNKKRYGNSMRRFFIGAVSKQRKQEMLTNKLVNYIMNIKREV